MILVPGMSLQAVLAGAVAANQPEVHVNYIDYDMRGQPTTPTPYRIALNGTNDVTILSAPDGKNQMKRSPISVSIYNKDTSSVTVTVKTYDGTTEYILVKQTLATSKTLCWEYEGDGWYTV